MRSGCQWCAVLLLLAGCGCAPADRSADSAATGTAAAPAPAPEVGTAADTLPAPGTGAGSAANPDRLSALAAMRFLEAHPEALVLDVRDPQEWDDDLGHLEGSRLIPVAELPARMHEIDAWKTKPIVVVCRAGGRSHTAAEMLRDAGFDQAMNLEGGLLAWRAAEKVRKPAP